MARMCTVTTVIADKLNFHHRDAAQANPPPQAGARPPTSLPRHAQAQSAHQRLSNGGAPCHAHKRAAKAHPLCGQQERGQGTADRSEDRVGRQGRACRARSFSSSCSCSASARSASSSCPGAPPRGPPSPASAQRRRSPLGRRQRCNSGAAQRRGGAQRCVRSVCRPVAATRAAAEVRRSACRAAPRHVRAPVARRGPGRTVPRRHDRGEGGLRKRGRGGRAVGQRALGRRGEGRHVRAQERRVVLHRVHALPDHVLRPRANVRRLS